jgi:hypothetical protein
MWRALVIDSARMLAKLSLGVCARHSYGLTTGEQACDLGLAVKIAYVGSLASQSSAPAGAHCGLSAVSFRTAIRLPLQGHVRKLEGAV